MKISLNWLSDFIQFNQKPEDLATLIGEHCFEVEEIIPVSDVSYDFSEVYVARVMEWQKHPNADRLRVVRLSLGDREVYPVVCGANNFDVGDKVALALPGAFIPQNVHSEEHESYVLGKATIRGIESQGMICSAFELGITKEPETKPEILVLSKSAEYGLDLKDYYDQKAKIRDHVLDLSLPANRPDLYSHLGIARELASILHFKAEPVIAKLQSAVFKPAGAKKLSLAVENPVGCPYYIGVRASVSVHESPEFIKERLVSLGLRPINNVVDITNYVMYELGEPLHAFDSKYVEGGIIVRNAHKGEKITTIDHKERILDQETLVIADKKKALAVAGIMGGVQSEVTEKTTEIILEAANFEPVMIRKSSKNIGLRTDGSGFWEKGLDPKQAEMGALRAWELLVKYADAKLIEMDKSGALAAQKNVIRFSAGEINSLLGTEYKAAKIKSILSSAGFRISGNEKMSVDAPWYRKDIVNYADLADEILKITGLNIIEKRPVEIKRSSEQVNQEERFENIKEHLARMGMNEVQNYSFVSEEDIKTWGDKTEDFIKIKNPLSADQTYLKRNLLVPLLKTTALNSKNFDRFVLFEVGKGYQGFLKEDSLLTFVIYDRSKNVEDLVSESKGYLENLLQEYSNGKAAYELDQQGQIDISAGDRTIGSMGPIRPDILRAYGLDSDVVYVKVHLNELFAQSKKFEQINKYPSKSLDTSIIVKQETAWGEIERILRQKGSDLIKDIQVFEAPYLYPKNKLPKFHSELLKKGLKNIAFSLIFQANNHTLTDSEISPIYAKIIEELKSKLGAEIR